MEEYKNIKEGIRGMCISLKAIQIIMNQLCTGPDLSNTNMKNIKDSLPGEINKLENLKQYISGMHTSFIALKAMLNELTYQQDHNNNAIKNIKKTTDGYAATALDQFSELEVLINKIIVLDAELKEQKMESERLSSYGKGNISLSKDYLKLLKIISSLKSLIKAYKFSAEGYISIITGAISDLEGFLQWLCNNDKKHIHQNI